MSAPLLDRAVAHAPRAASVVDLVVRALVGAIVLLHILPEGWETVGLLAPAMLAVGWSLPLVFERLPGLTGARETVVVVFAAVGLVVHSLIDGMALEHAQEPWLPLAIVLHTVPVGVIAWRGARAVANDGAGVGVLVLAALATVGGFFGGAALLPVSAGPVLAAFQCLVGGTLLHVLGHGHMHHDHDHHGAPS